jgi:hypothetical protein
MHLDAVALEQPLDHGEGRVVAGQTIEAAHEQHVVLALCGAVELWPHSRRSTRGTPFRGLGGRRPSPAGIGAGWRELLRLSDLL